MSYACFPNSKLKKWKKRGLGIEEDCIRTAGQVGIQSGGCRLRVGCYHLPVCARYSFTKDGKLIIRIGEFECEINVGARYNIAPTQKAPVILPVPGGFVAPQLRWGWQMPGINGPLINAQAETVTQKPTFRANLHRRCLVPADGFYEWTSDKTPIRFTKRGNEPFCFAGLWQEIITHPHDEPVTEMSFLILTTAPNLTVGRVHNRMPFIVHPMHYYWWLGEGDLFQTVLNFPDRDELDCCPVQPSLNKAGTEGPDLIRPYLKPQRELF